ncbi:MaoC family dehydratase [Bhargavaea ginsengi]|uniref:MaoC family dehydratase n=1 Tax=Bhargavaea ginsengi TaxID=426757 RepID=UPI002041D298|nr:MaoC family dehydratase [Bhargavaea ginsengi]MCM3087944.1 MaoC family dehydratase [Bhargavaea ginsengi]
MTVQQLVIPLTVTAEQIVDYGHASGDLNPIHMDPEAARAHGYRDRIAHGLLMMGICSSRITEALGGKPERLVAKFKDIVYPDDQLQLELEVTSDGEGTGSLNGPDGSVKIALEFGPKGGNP